MLSDPPYSRVKTLVLITAYLCFSLVVLQSSACAHFLQLLLNIVLLYISLNMIILLLHIQLPFPYHELYRVSLMMILLLSLYWLSSVLYSRQWFSTLKRASMEEVLDLSYILSTSKSANPASIYI